MCLYPTLIRNKKYTKTKKNGGIIPPITDPRIAYIPIGCQECMECRKQKAREWQVRLTEDIKTNKNGKFITLTFSDQSIKELTEQPKIKQLTGYAKDNQIATTATRLFLERWRKQYNKSLRHWLVTELGHEGTENIHLHGIIWTNETYQAIREKWNYGHIWPRPETTVKTWVNQQTVNYIVKYINKIDEHHSTYKSKILTSSGIGNRYTHSINSKQNQYTGATTRETYRTPMGHKITIPIYWRNKIYTESERERLWIHRIDRNERWICGEKVKATDTETINQLLKHYQQISNKLGYGRPAITWEEKQYKNQIKEMENARRDILTKQRINNATEKLEQKDTSF